MCLRAMSIPEMLSIKSPGNRGAFSFPDKSKQTLKPTRFVPGVNTHHLHAGASPVCCPLLVRLSGIELHSDEFCHGIADQRGGKVATSWAY